MLRKILLTALFCLMPFMYAHAQRTSVGSILRGIISAVSSQEKTENSSQTQEAASRAQTSSSESERYYQAGLSYLEEAEKKIKDENSGREEVTQYVKQSAISFERAAKLGHIKAQYELGRLYYLNYDLFPDDGNGYYTTVIKASIFWLEQAAKSKYTKAQYELGNLYYTLCSDFSFGSNFSPKYDGSEAIKFMKISIQWLELAAKSGEKEAYILLGKIYFDYAEDARLNKCLSYSWFSQDIVQGDAVAQLYLGRIFEEGKCTPSRRADYKQAFELYTKSHQQGNYDALSAIAQMYARGRYVSKDLKKAFQLSLQAAEGSAEAVCYVSEAYANGLGVKRNQRKAQEWESKCIEASEMEAGI